MGQEITVWLMRHGEAEGMNGRCCGRYDAPLSLEGVAQAKRVAERLACESISHMYSSTLQRALKTAQIVADPHGLRVETLEDLAEINFGVLEGMRYEEIE